MDYDQKSLDEIQQFFADEHFTVLTAHDGTQALEMFDTKSPDLVLTSALLPKLNGFELCKKITSGEVPERSHNRMWGCRFLGEAARQMANAKSDQKLV